MYIFSSLISSNRFISIVQLLIYKFQIASAFFNNIKTKCNILLIWRSKLILVVWGLIFGLIVIGLVLNFAFTSTKPSLSESAVVVTKHIPYSKLNFLNISDVVEPDAMPSEHENLCRLYKQFDLPPTIESGPQYTYRYKHARAIQAPKLTNLCDQYTQIFIAIMSNGLYFERRKSVCVVLYEYNV